MTIKLMVPCLAALLLSGCVTAGYEGAVGRQMRPGQINAQREANRTIKVYKTAPKGYTQLGGVKARRCDRNFLEASPQKEDITADLKLAAYAKGGDAISNVTTHKINGLAANCWYVLEGTANVWQKN